MTGTDLTILVALAAACCALVLGSAASAQSPTTLTFKELSKGSTFDFVDQVPMSMGKGEPSASAGDLIVFTNPLANASGKRIGRLYAHCTALVAARRAANAPYACEGLVVLAGGTLSVQAFLAQMPVWTNVLLPRPWGTAIMTLGIRLGLIPNIGSGEAADIGASRRPSHSNRPFLARTPARPDWAKPGSEAAR